jgi:hypothetical protein
MAEMRIALKISFGKLNGRDQPGDLGEDKGMTGEGV